MAGPNQLLNKAFTAGGVIAVNKIVKFDAVDDQVVEAAANTDLVMGVSLEPAAASGDRLEVAVLGIAEVKAAGTIARGDYVVSDASGDGVAGTATTAKQQAIGIAMASAVSGDIFPVMIARSQFDLA